MKYTNPVYDPEDIMLERSEFLKLVNLTVHSTSTVLQIRPASTRSWCRTAARLGHPGRMEDCPLTLG